MGILRVWNGSGWDEIKGERGESGASAYQIAVNEGFVGTEQQWLDSLAADPIDPVEIENAVTAAIDAEPRVAANTSAIARVDPGTTGVVGQSLTIGPSGPAWMDEPVFNVKHPRFGAIGDNVADDTAAIQAAITAAQAAGGGVVLFPFGTYNIAGTLTITGEGVTLRGVGRNGVTGLWKQNAGTLFVLDNVSYFAVESLFILTTSGHMFDAVSSIYHARFDDLKLKQYSTAHSIFHLDDTISGRPQADYVDNVWNRVESIHELTATVPTFNIRSYAANRNRFIDCRPNYSGNYHYWVESTHAAGGKAIGNVWEGITGEVLNGGAIKILGGMGTRISDFDMWDFSATITRDLIVLDSSTTNGTKSTNHSTIENVRRVDGTRAANVFDLRIGSGGGNAPTTLINCGGYTPFAVYDFGPITQIGGSVTFDWGANVTRLRSDAPSTFTQPVQLASFTTAARPTAASAGAGATIWNTTTNKPNYSDGTNWRDANGTVV